MQISMQIIILVYAPLAGHKPSEICAPITVPRLCCHFHHLSRISSSPEPMVASQTHHLGSCVCTGSFLCLQCLPTRPLLSEGFPDSPTTQSLWLGPVHRLELFTRLPATSVSLAASTGCAVWSGGHQEAELGLGGAWPPTARVRHPCQQLGLWTQEVAGSCTL